MEATRLQMQNFLIFLLDLVGVTVGYFAAVWLRFGNIETGYTVMGNDTYYRWLIAIVVLMMIYFLFRPNRGFFKRKFIEEMRMNLQTVILMAAGMAMIGHKVVPSRRGGIERVLTIMCPLMIKKGHQVTCFNRSGDKVENEYVKTVKRKKYRGVQLKKVITINKRGLAAMTSSFSAAICAAFGKYDVVHFHAEGPSAFLWIPKLFGKRCIVTIHGIDWARDKWKHGFGSRYIKFGEYIAAKYADEVIVLSEKVQKYFKKFYDRDTVLIPNGVMTHENRKANLITQKFGLHKDEYICALSRLTEEKGIHFLIEAYKELKTDKKLVIAGAASDTDEYVKMLKEMAGDDPNIIFTGFVSGKILEEIYSNAYVYVLPSKLEGMPLSLLEAMSYGNCVIGSDIAEIADVVEDKAILFKKANVEDLKEKLQMVCDDVELVEKYKNEASGYICGRYNWEDVVNRTVEVYRGKKSCKEKLVENSSVASI